MLTDGIGAIWLIDLLLDDTADVALDATPHSRPKEASEEALQPGPERQPGTVTNDFTKALHPFKEGVTASFGIAPADAADVVVARPPARTGRGQLCFTTSADQRRATGLASEPRARWRAGSRLFRYRPLEGPHSRSAGAATTFWWLPRRRASAGTKSGSVNRAPSSDW